MPVRVAMLVAFLLLGHAAPAPAQAKPDGEMRMAMYVTIAPAWFDPGEVTGFITPFWLMWAMHDALVKTMPGKARRRLSARRARKPCSSACVRKVPPCSSAASTAPSAAMPAMFSVPERRPVSCPPPMISGVKGAPSRRYSMPMPFGAYSLWPENGA